MPALCAGHAKVRRSQLISQAHPSPTQASVQPGACRSVYAEVVVSVIAGGPPLEPSTFYLRNASTFNKCT
eukprot:366520-Chlamydomonas_euryale.AAC.21